MNARLLVCLSAGLLISSAALADKINAKTGLWEMTTSSEMSGGPAMPSIPPDVLAKMPPEQRARMEQMMKGAPGMGERKTQSCVTEKDLERGMNPQTDREMICKPTQTKVTSTSQEIHMECNGEKVKGTGVMKMTISDRENIDGTMEMNMVTNGRPINMKMRIKGKWLGANCGTVKPGE